jgi:hypothetical protein
MTKIRNILGFSALVLGGFSVGACGGDKVPGPEGLPIDKPNLPGQVDAIAKQCGLECSAKGVLEGNASISGDAKIDAFFGSVVNFTGKANLIADGINGELANIAVSLGIPGNSGAAEIKAALDAKITANVEGTLKIKAQAPKCEVSAKATVEAQAKCEGMVTPPMASVECKGGCQVDAKVSAMCDASATTVCRGQAPMLSCSGTCSGSCEVDLMAAGTCDGTCEGSTDAGGMCTGKCKTEMSGGAMCTGKCKGECEYTPPMGVMCEANAKVECKAMAGASVMCNGRCDGEVTPPMVSAECQASVKADASVNAECTPPKLHAEFKFKAGASADAKADFEATLEIFIQSYAKILAHLENVKVLGEAGASITASADGAIKASVDKLTAEVNIKAAFQAKCALTQIPMVATAITGATTKMQASASAAATLTTAFSG